MTARGLSHKTVAWSGTVINPRGFTALLCTRRPTYITCELPILLFTDMVITEKPDIEVEKGFEAESDVSGTAGMFNASHPEVLVTTMMHVPGAL